MTMSETKTTHEQFYLTPHQAAEYLNSSASTLAKRRLYGGGPRFTRIGRAVRYRKSDLDEFMALNLQRSTFERAEP
jgi:excisionase family DNA binding protein